MKFTAGKILNAYVRNVNGEGTMKELVLDLSRIDEDADGEFDNVLYMHLPLSYTYSGDGSEFLGKVLKISIE